MQNEVIRSRIAEQHLSKDFPYRFWKKVNKDGPFPSNVELGKCWVWTGSRTFYDYGQISGSLGILVRSHRASWILHNGAIPEGMKVLHKCDNPPCVNPAHLFLGSQQENMQDMTHKGRHGDVHLIGETNGFSKLTKSLVLNIRKTRTLTGMSYENIGKLFGIGASHAHRIINRKSWTHI